jgi:hypothetical protein
MKIDARESLSHVTGLFLIGVLQIDGHDDEMSHDEPPG